MACDGFGGGRRGDEIDKVILEERHLKREPFQTARVHKIIFKSHS